MKLTLSYPVSPIHINQLFGVNPQNYAPQNGHNGIDFTAYHGQPVFATHDGLAIFQIDTGGGCGVVIITKDKFEYEGKEVYFKTIYWHLCNSHTEPLFKSPFEDKTGFTEIKKGQLIGYADNTGNSSGDHLHFGLKPVAQGESWGTWYNTKQNNGYAGAINPQPFFEAPKDEIKENIISLQKSLVNKGYLIMPPNTNYGHVGNLTITAINKYQGQL